MQGVNFNYGSGCRSLCVYSMSKCCYIKCVQNTSSVFTSLKRTNHAATMVMLRLFVNIFHTLIADFSLRNVTGLAKKGTICEHINFDCFFKLCSLIEVYALLDLQCWYTVKPGMNQ